MSPGPELDALVAEKVMGGVLRMGKAWEVNDEPPVHRQIIVMPGGKKREFRPSTSISAAWEVVEKMVCRWRLELSGPDEDDKGHGYSAKFLAFFGEDKSGDSELAADTAPHAICLAALKAVGAL